LSSRRHPWRQRHARPPRIFYYGRWGEFSDGADEDRSRGNVGIGTTNPQATLDVNGDALINTLTVGLGSGSVSTNTAVGRNALQGNTTGQFNTAVGQNALLNNTTGEFNTAVGRSTLLNNTTGTTTPPLDKTLSTTTPQAIATPPLDDPLSSLTPKAAKTSPLVETLSTPTPQAQATSELAAGTPLARMPQCSTQQQKATAS
jgi:hypothetical protein